MIKKFIVTLSIFTMALAVNPIMANAEWKSDQSGWWYTEGSSYATGWRNIGGNWYYFWPNSGYMASQTTINGSYVDENGVWIDDSNYNVSAKKAENIINDRFGYQGAHIKCSGLSNNNWIIRVYEDNAYKTTTTGWYYVDINTGIVSVMN